MENIRNFLIISHVDHGKSTLADRFLEITETVPKLKMREQFLDTMDLERERGITIKLQPCRMEFKEYILNLIDTPGHVDFSYEVSRSLAAVEGAILLVDATKGIQAQTISNLELAKKQNLVIIPVINKIDSPNALTESAKTDLSQLLNISANEVFLCSAKLGTNVRELLDEVIKKVPRPQGDVEKPFRALIFDSKYDPYKGIIAFVRVIDGKISAGQKIHLIQAKTGSEVKEVGVFKPELKKSDEIRSGEIGYLATGVKESGKVKVGDTITTQSFTGTPLPGYMEPQSVVFASIYPENPDGFDDLKEALFKLKLSDASFTFESEAKEALGRGFSCGFLGSLHAEIISERLKREFGFDLIISPPSVIFKITKQNNEEVSIYSASDWPEESDIKGAKEPWVNLEIMTPAQYMGRILEILKDIKGKSIETKYFASDKVLLVYEIPLMGIITNFYDNLKGASQGFASMNYKTLGYRPADLVKLEIFIAGEKEEILSKIVHKERAFQEGKKMVKKLKEILPGQLFSVPLQAVVSGRILARETISAKRKDVTGALYGGDYSRKRKLLEKQKKGKKKLKERGQFSIPPKTYLEIFKG